jgi:hypothetical protein
VVASGEAWADSAPVVLVSLAAAGCFGLSSAIQHTAVRRAQRRVALHPGLLAEVARRPGWVLGALLQLIGVVLHLYAVNLGALSVVQPMLTVGLVIALEAQRLCGVRLPNSARFASVLVIIGLVGFLASSLQPGTTAFPGRDTAEWTASGYPLAGALFVGAIVLGALITGLRNRVGIRAIAFGMAAGTLMATSAAAGKAWGTILRTDGWSEVLTSWQLWAGLALGFVGFLVSQAAFQAGPLAGPLSAMMAVDPVVGVVLGIVEFHEPLHTGIGVVHQLGGLALAVLGVVLLARIHGGVIGYSRRYCVSLDVQPPG